MIYQTSSNTKSSLQASAGDSVADADGVGVARDVVWKGSSYGWCQHRPRENYGSARGAIEPIDHSHYYNSTNAANRDKQDEIRRIDFPYCGPVRIQQKPWALNSTAHGYDGTTGLALWSGSFLLAHYVDNMLKSQDWKIDTSEMSNEMEGANTRPWTFVELGAGLGLPSAMAAKCGMDVIATDYDDAVLPLLEHNMLRNLDEEESTTGPRPRVYKLDWNEASSLESVVRDLQEGGGRGADVILLSDVIYGATRPLWESLLAILNKLREQRTRLVEDNGEDNFRSLVRYDGSVSRKGDPLVLFAYTQRRKDITAEEERRFFAMLKGAGIKAYLIPFSEIPYGESEEFLLTSLYELRWT